MITDPEIFDIYRSILKHVDLVSGVAMSKILDSISSGLASELEVTMRDVDNADQQSYMAHKLPLELYAFLLHWFVSAAEKVKQPEGEDAPAAAKPKKGRGGKAGGKSKAAANRRKEIFTWIDQIPATLGLISKVLRLKTQRIWTTTAERDTFIKYATVSFFLLCCPDAFQSKLLDACRSQHL
jgi:condensin complex subunit 1